MARLSDRARRDLLHGSLEVLALAVLADGERYGYALQKVLRDASGQAIKPGTLYPLLHRLEAEGLIEATWESDTGRRRKWYGLTPAGGARLRHAATDWQAAIARMQALVLPAVRRVAHRAVTDRPA